MKSFIRITASLLAALTVLLSFNTAAYALGIEDAYHHGDVTLDNKIDVTDATAIQKYAVALAEFSPEQLSKADVNYDGVINVADATLIQKIASGLYIPLAGKKGVDISSHNGDIDIKKIRDAGYSFVMIRCGYGEDKTSQDDKRFEENVRKCEELGMPWGVYLYSYALTVDDARSASSTASVRPCRSPLTWRMRTATSPSTVCRATSSSYPSARPLSTACARQAITLRSMPTCAG